MSQILKRYSTNIQDISIRKYKHVLWEKIKDILEIAGYDITVRELIYESGHMPVLYK